MHRYVDADLLKCAALAVDKETFTFDEVIALIDSVKPADVQEVKHGHWIKEDNTCYSPFDGSPPYWYVCSLCKRRQRNAEPFCNCGAKMDLKGE